MHTLAPDRSVVRALSALAMGLIVVVPALWAMVVPVEGLSIEAPDGAHLPLEWTLGPDETATFDITLPREGRVRSADLTLEGSGVDTEDVLEHGVGNWLENPEVEIEGLLDHGDGLAVRMEHHDVWVGPDQLGDAETMENLEMHGDLTLARTSPNFTGSGGGFWKFYKELAIALNSGEWEYDTSTFIEVQFPKGRCSDVKEIRVADPDLREVPYQVAGVDESADGKWLLGCELMFATDMPPEGPRPYRVYYGNPAAQAPDYSPLLLGAEMFEYSGINDTDFTARWKPLRWSGANGAGRSYADIRDLPGEGGMFDQGIDVSPGRSFSQVWTDLGQKHGDFQLVTWLSGYSLKGPQRSTGIWALDFRVAGQDCYRLAYTHSLNNLVAPKFSLYRVSTDRHLTTGTSTNDWVVLGERRVGPINATDTVRVLVRAVDDSIMVWVDGHEQPIFNVRDTNIATGYLGTFLGGKGVALSGEVTKVTCSYGPMFVFSPDINLTDKTHTWVPSEERSQHFKEGTYVSQVMDMDGVRETLFRMDVALPPGTGYSADLLNATGAPIVDNVRDGAAVPDGGLEGGFKLQVVLSTEEDHLTPVLRSWGVGYRAAVHLEGDRGPEEMRNAAVDDGALVLGPTRDLWLKEESAVLGPGNIPEDEKAVDVGSLVRYGGHYRLYYTGVSSSGARSICMATTTDGRSFHDHRAVLPSALISLRWDVNRMDPSVVRYHDVWLMYYVGMRGGVGQVGIAVSSDGVHWVPNADPVLGPGQGGFDDHSIEDCAVVHDHSRSVFHMYYSGRASSSSGRTAIGHASSYDGGTWVKSAQNPVLSPGPPGDWDSGYVLEPFPVLTRDQVILYYLGGKGSQPGNDPSALGYAFSDNGLDFKRSLANPVMEPRKGGLADDYYGIRGMLVTEDGEDRHFMMFSGQGITGVHRAFVAESGYHKAGHYLSRPFVLEHAPAKYLKVDLQMEEGPDTDVSVFARTSHDGDEWTEWLPLTPGEPASGLPPGALLQLRVNLTSKLGESTPRMTLLSLLHESYIPQAQLTYDKAHTLPDYMTHLELELVGDDVHLVKSYARVGQSGYCETVMYGGHGQYGEGPDFDFGYRLVAQNLPGEAPVIRWANFTIGYVSRPSNVRLDVGDDGAWDWSLEVLQWEGTEVAHIEDVLGSVYDEGQGEVTVTIRVTTGTLGTLALTAVSVVVDTPPVIGAATPEDDPVIDEDMFVDFKVEVENLDDPQPLTYSWTVDGEGIPENDGPTLRFGPDEGAVWDRSVTVTVEVSDGNYSDDHSWTVHVNELVPPANQAPYVDSTDPAGSAVVIDENDTIDFWISAVDPDTGPDPLVYRWFLDDVDTGHAGDTYIITTDYDWAGEYVVRVEAFDGKAGVNHTWSLRVNDVEEPGPKPDGNGNGGDDESPNWLPVLIVLVVLAIAGAGGVMYMRAQRARGAGGGTPGVAADGPVTAEVPSSDEVPEAPAPRTSPPEVPPSEAPPPVESTLAKDVAAAPGAMEAAAAAGVGAPLVGMPLGDLEKDRTFVVEELYVVHDDGRLIRHEARAERTAVDTDIFGGMFTAIQQFIQDSMGGTGSGTQVGRLDYGENRILVERGKHLFLAVIVFGEEQEVLREAMRDVLNRIEGSYAGVIERWSGDQSQLAGVGDLVAPLIGMTQDLNREAIMARTRTEGVKMLSEVEFFQGFVRLKVAVRNDTNMVITDVATDISYDSNVLRVDRVEPEYGMTGTKVTIGTVGPSEKKTVAYYLDPLICQESDIDGTVTFKDAKGQFGAVTMKRRRADIVCPIFFTEENANTAMLKRLVHEELKESDSKIFTIPKMLPPVDAFELGKEVVQGHDVRFVREFVEGGEEGRPFHGEAWFYGVTKVKGDKMVMRTSIWEDRKTIEFFVASSRIEAITGLLAELGHNLNKALRTKYLGRVSAELVVDRDQQDEVKGMGLLIDKYSEGEVEAGEVDQL